MKLLGAVLVDLASECKIIFIFIVWLKELHIIVNTELTERSIFILLLSFHCAA